MAGKENSLERLGWKTDESEDILKGVQIYARRFIQQTIATIESIPVDNSFVNACFFLSDCKGKIVTTGMGKAGHAARKAASTLCSLNLPAVYIHPGDASHGDSGVITKGDVLLAFSTSGKTREVIELIHLARHLEVDQCIAITSHPDAPLRDICDIEINMGKVEESGYLHIAPTTSITVMLVIADMLATIAAEIKGVKMEDFAIRHHGGYLGEKSHNEAKENQR